jgi:hypothetical protein
LPDVNTSAVPELQVEPVPGNGNGALTRPSAAPRLADVHPRHVVPLLAAALCLGGCDAGGPAFDALLLDHLAKHFEQGVKLATGERRSGVEPRTRALAERMIADRAQMTDRIRGSGT